MGHNDINIFLLLENPWTFLLAKQKTWKRIFNTNTELSQNRTEKQIMPSKTITNWLFNYIWCYLFIACYDWKIGVFQQTVVRVYYILIYRKNILHSFLWIIYCMNVVWRKEICSLLCFHKFESVPCISVAGNAVDVCVVDKLEH